MIIVSGRIYVAPEHRESYLASALEAVVSARQAPGCLDFVVAADPLEPDRVNVYEQWESAEELEAFRGDGPAAEQTVVVQRADVARHQISSSGPP